ncbi:hypothetical protein [Pengzhenrongella sp.]|uniref:hypothetical protein n=1 Tax=Pengzhenrongella sp. TaxID=2888820 RepID=UPI002F9422C2
MPLSNLPAGTAGTQPLVRRRSALVLATAVALTALAVSILGATPPAAATTTTRIAALQPFSVPAPANTSFGSLAKFESASSTKTAALLRGTPQLNSLAWSIAVARATSVDPMTKVTNIKTGKVWYFRVPSGSVVTTGTDKHMTVVQPDGYTAYECYKMTKVTSTSWTTTYVVQQDLRTNGLAGGARASGISQIMGLIRTQEVANKKIPHTLAVGIPNSMLKYGYVWPARAQDSDAATAYSGPIPMGSMMGIPPSVDLTKLNLSPEGLALGHGLQDYGAHVLLRAGAVALYAEPLADQTAVYRMRVDWKDKLYPLMRIMTNNTPTTVGGGGIRRQPDALPLS